MNLQEVKQRFEIIGNSPMLNLALETAIKVAPTEISVLVTGESGVGKEVFSKIIHQLSNRKHGHFIAVNCGAIPEGTIDSELFGHEKGSFTGAHDTRKGYFETVNGGTIFLDEVGELPLETQSRLLRVLENGEFIKVGSSKVQKTDVRVVAATNKDLLEETRKGKFREDLYYRLCTVPIKVPPLRERKEDIHLIFRKYAVNFAEAYRTEPVTLTPEAVTMLTNYSWPGNVRQLRNIAEQICVLESSRIVDATALARYLPHEAPPLPMVLGINADQNMSERDIFYKVLFDLRKDVSDLKKIVLGLMENSANQGQFIHENEELLRKVLQPATPTINESARSYTQPVTVNAQPVIINPPSGSVDTDHEEIIEAIDASRLSESLSIEQKEVELIRKALAKNNGRRRKAAQDLGISERTLYRKIKQYDIEN